MNRTTTYMVLCCSILLSGCSKEHLDDCFTSTGDVVQEERAVSHFTTLVVNDNIDVILTQDTIDRVVIEAGENLMRHIEVEMVGNALHLSNTNKCNWVRSFKVPVIVHVSTRSLNYISYHGTGDITGTNTLITSRFEIEQRDAGGSVNLDLQVDTAIAKLIRGVGDVTYTGTANSVILYTATPGHINALELDSPYAFVTTGNTGDIRVRATQTLFAFIEHVGDIYYAGSPSEIFPTITGSGEMIKVD